MKDWKKEIDEIIKGALKSKDMQKANVIRMLKSDLSHEELKDKTPLTEEAVMQVIQRAVKKRKESIEEFKKVGQEDRVKEEEMELSCLSSFLPEQLSEEEVGKIVSGIIQELKAEGMKDFGRVMGAVMQKVKGQAEGKLVNEMVKKKLSVQPA